MIKNGKIARSGAGVRNATVQRCPVKFVPQFWMNMDKRTAICQEIKRRYEELLADTGADSYQKRLLAQRAVFIALKLETAEVNATETGEMDWGSYTQMVNCLVGLLRALGDDKLARKVKKAGKLAKYLAPVEEEEDEE